MLHSGFDIMDIIEDVIIVLLFVALIFIILYLFWVIS